MENVNRQVNAHRTTRRTRFPGKESLSVSFNLTAIGRALLAEQASAAGVSKGDYLEMLIRERAGQPPVRPNWRRLTGARGGAKSYFFGKNRGTTTAVCVTPLAHRLLDEQVVASRMSRGDYVEYLLREKAGEYADQGDKGLDICEAAKAMAGANRGRQYIDLSGCKALKDLGDLSAIDSF